MQFISKIAFMKKHFLHFQDFVGHFHLCSVSLPLSLFWGLFSNSATRKMRFCNFCRRRIFQHDVVVPNYHVVLGNFFVEGQLRHKKTFLVYFDVLMQNLKKVIEQAPEFNLLSKKISHTGESFSSIDQIVLNLVPWKLMEWKDFLPQYEKLSVKNFENDYAFLPKIFVKFKYKFRQNSNPLVPKKFGWKVGGLQFQLLQYTALVHHKKSERVPQWNIAFKKITKSVFHFCS